MAEPAKAGSSKNAIGMIGQVAFFIGFALCVVGGILWPGNGAISLGLLVLGIVVSLLNITAKEVVLVMVAAIALIVTSTGEQFLPLNFGADAGLGSWLDNMVTYLAVFMVPVAVISAIRAVIAVGRHGD